MTTTHFFPDPLTRLLVVVANETDPDCKLLSPHDLLEINNPVVENNMTSSSSSSSGVILPNFSSSWNDHIPVPVEPTSAECKQFTKYVQDFLALPSIENHSPLTSPNSPTDRIMPVKKSNTCNGVLIVASARHFRFYEKWSQQFFSKNVHVINTGQAIHLHQETFLRSVQRALRVVSPELHNHKQSLSLIWSIHVDAVCGTCSDNEDGNDDKTTPSSSALRNALFPRHHELLLQSENNVSESSSSSTATPRVIEGYDTATTALVCFSFFGCKLSEEVIKLATNIASWDSPKILPMAGELRVDTLKVAMRKHLKPKVVETTTKKNNNNNNDNDNGQPRSSFFIGRSYARVGLMGNPSDQLHGKSIAVTLKNFWSTVTVTPNNNSSTSGDSRIHFVPHPVADDTMNFSNINALTNQVTSHGYSGGIRLLQATCKRFVEHTLRLAKKDEDNNSNNNTDASMDAAPASAAAREVLSQMKRNGFIMQYDTNVPRQVGLAGSSCIVSAALKALLRFYGVFDCPHFLPENSRPTFVLDVEAKELGINAGLMDRVAQMYEGCMAMDFTNSEETEKNGYAKYSRHPVSSLPKLHLAVALDPSDSGKIHATVRKRFAERDPEVLESVKTWVGLVDEAVRVMDEIDGQFKKKDNSNSNNNIDQLHHKIRSLMDQNFDLRRKLYGDECLGWKNLKMVEIARAHGASAKFPGSGGAVLVSACPKETTLDNLAADMETHGFSLIELDLFEPK